MADRYDVVVVGAGPAGSAAAFHAARGGRRVLLVDRCRFPREKTCGDAVSPRGVMALRRMGIARLAGQPVVGARFEHWPGGGVWTEEFDAHEGPGHGVVVRRAVLDTRLARAAQGAGAESVVADVRGISPVPSGAKGVLVDLGDQGYVRAATVVVAAGSGASRKFGDDPDAAHRAVGWGIAARGYYATSTETGDLLRIFFPVSADGRVLAGYVWAFPAGRHCWNIGVGVFRPPGAHPVSLRAILREFLALHAERLRLGELRQLGPVTSAPIAVVPLVRSGGPVLAVGDAAGLANPFTGEGIAVALESGELAGRVVAEGLTGAGDRYAARLAALSPGRAVLRPALRRLYEHPGMLLDRGADLFTDPSGLLGGAMRRLVWDRVARQPTTDDSAAWQVRAVDRVLASVVQAGRRVRPLFGELLADIIRDPDTGAGRATAFAIEAGAAVAGAGRAADAAADGLLEVAEMVVLVAALHDDLAPGVLAARGRAGWGRAAAGLALADTLTAEALRRLYVGSGPGADALGDAARRFLGVRAAGVAGTSPPDPQATLGGRAALLVAAAGVVAGCRPEALPAWVPAAARWLGTEPGSRRYPPLLGAEAARAVAATECLWAAWRARARVPAPVDGDRLRCGC